MPKMDGPWFDPKDNNVVDYEQNATDLFQALEEGQFSYADEMYKQVKGQFNSECKTWVVSREVTKDGERKHRFRVLPLHVALVYGAPDELIKKIMNAYPKAARAKDSHGRLPIHLAMKYNASEQLIWAILGAFPKGFFVKDNKGMLPLDYVSPNDNRALMKKYLPLIMDAKVEEERVKWEAEQEDPFYSCRQLPFRHLCCSE